MKTFYTYLWLRENGTPYYVGKGTKNRGFISWNHGVNRPNADARIVVQYWGSEGEALAMEEWWIALLGRQDNRTGILRNLTNGGERGSGHIPTVERRQKQSAALTGRKHSPAALKKMSTAQKLRWANAGADEFVRVQRLGKANLGTTASEETRRKISNGQKNCRNTGRFVKGQKPSENAIARSREVHTGNTYTLGKKLTADHRRKISAGVRGKKRSIETRSRMSAARTKWWAAKKEALCA